MHKIRKMRTKHTQAIRRGDTTRVRRRTLTHCTHHTHTHTLFLHNSSVFCTETHKPQPADASTPAWWSRDLCVKRWSASVITTTKQNNLWLAVPPTPAPAPSSTPHYQTAHLLSSSSVTAVAPHIEQRCDHHHLHHYRYPPRYHNNSCHCLIQ